MKQSVPKWLIGVVAVLVVGGVSVFGFLTIKKASDPEVETTKPPASFYGSYQQSTK